MSLWQIAWRNLWQRRLSSLLTGLSMALGVALVVAVLVIHGAVRDSFQRAAYGYDIIVGAKGGKLQLVLNTVYHLSQPIENIPWSYYREFVDGKFSSQVAVAIPYCLGDNYEGFRVVGTTPDMFEKLEYGPQKKYRFSSGQNFRADSFFQAVVGSVVARRTGLKVGDRFQPTHGLAEEGDGHKHDAFEVVGILAPTGTPNDRALFVNIEGFLLLDGHAKPVETPADGAASNATPTTEASHEHEEHDAHDHHAHAAEGGEAGHESGESAHEHEPGHEHEHADHDHSDEPGHHHEQATEGEDAHQHEHDDHQHADDHEHEEHSHEGPAQEGEHDHAHVEHDHGQPADDAEHAHDHGHDHAHDHGHDHDHDHAHDDEAHSPLPEAQREVTAVLLRTANPIAGYSLPRYINKEPFAQAVLPVFEITSLFEGVVGNVQKLLLALAVLVVIVAAVGMMVAIYNTMHERRREIAVMRALGADRRTVMWIVLWESVLLALLGGLAGVVLGHGAIALLNPWIVDQTGVSIGILSFSRQELLLVPGLILLATLAGYVPALNAYRTDVAKALSSAP